MKLKPFNPGRHCEKCKAFDVALLYKEESGAGFLQCTCKRCGFQWEENCANPNDEIEVKLVE